MKKRKLKKIFSRIRDIPKGKILILYSFNRLKSIFLKIFKSNSVANPTTIMIEVTNRCNLKCKTCAREYDYGKKMNMGDISFELVKKIVDELYPYLDSIGLTGLGETFLYKELERSVDYIHSRNPGIIVSASINANLPKTTEIINELAGKLDTIQISIDGIEDIYEKVRVNSNFKNFTKNLSHIVEVTKNTKTDVMLNAVIFDKNYTQMCSIFEFAKSYDVKYLNFTPMNVVSITDKSSSYYSFYETDNFKTELVKLKEKIAMNPDMETTLDNFSLFEKSVRCPFLWDHFYITWDGYLAPCCAKPFPKEKNFGNLFENNMKNLINSKDFISFRRMWNTRKYPQFCKNCFRTL